MVTATKNRSGNQTTDRLSAALDTLEAGIKNLVQSGAWERYLRVQAAFHAYSYSNCLLILAQREDATRVAGFKTWQKLGRQVMKGEKAIWILAPRFFKVKEADERKDADGKEDENEEAKMRIYFRPVPVFDIAQTEGEELSIARNLNGSDEGLFDMLKEYSESNGCPVSVEDIRGTSNGFYLPKEHRIVVRNDLGPAQRAKTLAHEVAHSMLHRDHEVYAAHRGDCELEAESVAFVVLSYFGIDSGSYSFGYVTSWKDGDENAIKTLKACATRIQQTARAIIVSIDKGPGGEEAGLE